MEKLYYSKSTGGFYSSLIHNTNIPEDVVEITKEEHEALLMGQSDGKRIITNDEGKPVLADPIPPTQEQIIKQYEKNIQSLLDTFAKERDYDDITSLVSYINSTNETFKAEAKRGIYLRDLIWTKFYEIINKAETLPKFEELKTELPQLTWE